MVILTSKSPEETFRLGAEFGARVQPGFVLGLIGELGAGKTQYVKGFASGLGVTEPVHSPTFTLVNEYLSGRLPCYHLDLYRLENAEQVLHAGLEPYFRPEQGVTLVEWFDKVRGRISVSDRLLLVHIGVASETDRTIGYEDPHA